MAAPRQQQTDVPTPDEPLAPITDDEITEHIEVLYDNPDGIRHVNAVMTHDPTGRRIRREVVYDSTEKEVRETEVALKDGEVINERDDTGARWLSSGLVYVDALAEPMTLEDYIDLRAFDEAAYKLGAGWPSED